MRQDELSQLVWSIAERLKLSVVLARLGSNRHLEIAERPGTIVMSDGKPADWVFLSTEKPNLELIDAKDLIPGKWGWIQVTVPHEEGHILSLSRIAAKSDWYDSNTKQTLDNPASLKLFRRIASFFQKQLRSPVWIYDVRGGKAEPNHSIRYSAGAEEWVRNGGQLMQEGVPNVGYSLHDPAKT